MTSILWKCASPGLFAVLLIGFLGSCKPRAEWATLQEGTQWKLLAFGEGRAGHDSIAWIRLDATVVNTNGDETLAVHLDQAYAESADPIWQLLASRVPGDSMLLQFTGANFLLPNNSISDTLQGYVALRGMKSAAALRDARQKEYATLDTLLRQERITESFEEYRGLWIRTVKAPAAESPVRKGSEVIIHYRGILLDSTVVDDSRRMLAPFAFVYGNEGQVIKGLEMALERMHKGEVVEVIVPSWFAFGKRGSADGRIAPYTPLIYTVEVLEIGL